MITTDNLRAARARPRRTPRTLQEAKRLGLRTVFLSHSHRDVELAQGFVTLLDESGWDTYVDWADSEMPESPNRETARRIQEKIIAVDFFIFLATPNSMASRWCPWEIGYADGKKHIDQILVVPTRQGGHTHGNEYLQLYRRIEYSNTGELGVWRPGQTAGGVWLRNL